MVSHSIRVACVASLLTFVFIVSNPQLRAVETRKSGDPNIAQGKQYTFSIAPNYPLCTDAGDATDLTDGVLTGQTPNSGYWTETGTVGWNHTRAPIAITLDLGGPHRITGATLRSGGGGAGVSLPSSVAVLVSDDGSKFKAVGDLVELAERAWPPEYGSFSTYTYETRALATSGRYVRFVLVPSAIFAFTDEIEVFGSPLASDDAGTPSVAATPVSDEWFVDPLRLTRLGSYRRTTADLQRIEALVRNASAGKSERDALLAELATISTELKSGGARFPQKADSFRAIAPLNDFHRRALSVHGKLMATRGLKPLTIWHTPPYQLLEMFANPSRSPVSLAISAVPGEWRAETLNLTAASGQPSNVKLSFDKLPDGASLKVYQVEYVDTREGRWVASALVELDRDGDHYSTTVPAGMTRQIWFSFNPEGVQPGDYDAALKLSTSGFEQSIPLRLSVGPGAFPDRMACSLGLWDYVYDNAYEVTDENKPLAVQDMQTRHVDVVWCTSQTVPMPRPDQIDAEGNITGPIDYSRWDGFVKLSPNARYYAAFATMHTDSTFAGHQQGTPSFERAVSQWAKDWARHNKELGLKSGQVMVLFLDEPGAAEHFLATFNFAKPFNAATDDILVYCDPTGTATMDVEHAAKALEQCDVISPPQEHYARGGEPLAKFYHGLRERGKTLWFYNCSGPTRQMDPAYYRLQPWQALDAGATGAQYWAYADAGGASNWNEYTAVGRTSYAPAYIDRDSITTSKHWEAVREGLQDYQYVVMLRERAAALRAAGKELDARKAEDLATRLPSEVVRNVNQRFGHEYAYTWRDASSHAESARLRAFRLLSSLGQ